MLKTILGVNNTVVCDKCTNPFILGEKIICQAEYITDMILNLIDKDNIEIVGYPAIPSIKDIHNIWHEDCAPDFIKNPNVNKIKNIMINLSDKENHQLYIFLHDSLNQRI